MILAGSLLYLCSGWEGESRDVLTRRLPALLLSEPKELMVSSTDEVNAGTDVQWTTCEHLACNCGRLIHYAILSRSHTEPGSLQYECWESLFLLLVCQAPLSLARFRNGVTTG